MSETITGRYKIDDINSKRGNSTKRNIRLDRSKLNRCRCGHTKFFIKKGKRICCKCGAISEKS